MRLYRWGDKVSSHAYASRSDSTELVHVLSLDANSTKMYDSYLQFRRSNSLGG